MSNEKGKSIARFTNSYEGVQEDDEGEYILHLDFIRLTAAYERKMLEDKAIISSLKGQVNDVRQKLTNALQRLSGEIND